MLIDFRLSGFRSFKEEQLLSLVASGRDKRHPENLIASHRGSLLKTAALYGQNASGKSNLVRGLGCMRQVIVESATRMTQGDRIPGIVPFRLDAEYRERPSCFETTVILGKTLYVYGFSATPDRIHDEWLTVYPPRRKSLQWIDRRFDPATEKTDWAFQGPLQLEEHILRNKTRPNGLALSRGAELNIEPLSELYLWFRSKMWVSDLSKPPVGLIIETARFLLENERLQNRVADMIRHADLGIDGFSVIEEAVPPSELPADIAELLSEKGLRDTLTKRVSVRTTHGVRGSEKPEEFDLDREESNGTQRLFALAGPLLDALNSGALMVVDELECSMHPLLTRKLLELFHSPAANDKGAQLIFATHDSSLMDPELFRRDQIWIVEKKADGASTLGSLYDFDIKSRPRNTEAFQRNYLAGRYGGVPTFGQTFEDLEFE